MPPRLVAAMLVRNEADRYLRRVLGDLSLYCDAIVVLDDGSTDETPEVCASYGRVILHRNPGPSFLEDESALRFRLWRLALEAEPEWILAIDADEMLEERFKEEREALLSQEEYDRIPGNLPGPVLWSPLRMKHFGYASPRDRLRKYLRAVASLPHLDHSRILCEHPHLVEWID